MPRPIRATIRPQAIAHNLQRARVATHAAGSRIWAVVKANAYGHGIERIYSGLASADGLAMLDFDEARLVRHLGWDKPILMLEGCFDKADYASAFELDLTVVVHQQAQIDALASALAERKDSNLNVYLKMNTGMNRVGFNPQDYGAAFAQLRAIEGVGEIGLMTHFANADLPNGADKALALFNTTVAPIMAQYPNTMRCVSNSAATLTLSNAHFDWVRPGIMTYGGSPFADTTAAECGLQPAMTLNSQIIAVREIQAGDAIGYGSRFVAPRAMRIGVVACGYADGYPRHATEQTPIAIDGVRTHVVGRVSMDMLTVDLTDVPNAHVGSTVELWGTHIPIDEVAQASGTIGYELMCALAARVAVTADNHQ
ncbi:MAG: alr [Burkholderiaceae bacterium]|nr:alr [Burkholderiaceae bacterium]